MQQPKPKRRFISPGFRSGRLEVICEGPRGANKRQRWWCLCNGERGLRERQTCVRQEYDRREILNPVVRMFGQRKSPQGKWRNPWRHPERPPARIQNLVVARSTVR